MNINEDDGFTIRATSNIGVKYTKTASKWCDDDNNIWRPEEYNQKLICDCGCTSFHLFNGHAYSLSATCTECNKTAEVYSG